MEIEAEKQEKKHRRLTITELRNCKGFEAYSDERAEKTISTLETIAILFYELYMKQKQAIKRLTLKNADKHGERTRNAA
jgi:hypothetical protein